MIIIKNGTVIDGSGAAASKLDILISGGLIVRIGKIDPPSGCKVIDASEQIVCPGFIDMHGHSDLEILRDPLMKAKVQQGITTEVGGNCGIGVFPILRPTRIPKGLLTDILGYWPDFNWNNYDSYRASINSPYSLMMLQSHSMLRFNAIEGNPNRQASQSEIARMESMLDESLQMGCIGLSMGLYYAPCMYASRDELVRLARVVARHDGILSVHHRCEGSDIISSLKEIISVAEEAKVRLEVSHLKVIGMKNQHLLPEVFSLLEKSSQVIGFDQYPYDYGCTSLSSLLPPDLLALSEKERRSSLKLPEVRTFARQQMQNPDGWDSIVSLAGFDNIFITELEHFPEYSSLSLSTIANLRGQDPFDSLFDLLSAETGIAMMTDITETPDTLRQIFRHPLGCFGTDAIYTGTSGHPRSWNAAPHILQKSFLNQMDTTAESAIFRMTGKTAKRLGLSDRGFIREGLRADIVIFNPETVADLATSQDPMHRPQGIQSVMIAGEPQFF
jgi:N-acyl-D-amino-acid deacylase